MREQFVIDPLIGKRQQLYLATQLCRMVLKVCGVCEVETRMQGRKGELTQQYHRSTTLLLLAEKTKWAIKTSY